MFTPTNTPPSPGFKIPPQGTDPTPEQPISAPPKSPTTFNAMLTKNTANNANRTDGIQDDNLSQNVINDETLTDNALTPSQNPLPAFLQKILPKVFQNWLIGVKENSLNNPNQQTTFSTDTGFLSDLNIAENTQNLEGLQSLIANWKQLSPQDKATAWGNAVGKAKLFLWTQMTPDDRASLWQNTSPQEQVFIWQMSTPQEKTVLWNQASLLEKNTLWNNAQPYEKINLWNQLTPEDKVIVWQNSSEEDKISLWKSLPQDQRVLLSHEVHTLTQNDNIPVGTPLKENFVYQPSRTDSPALPDQKNLTDNLVALPVNIPSKGIKTDQGIVPSSVQESINPNDQLAYLSGTFQNRIRTSPDVVGNTTIPGDQTLTQDLKGILPVKKEGITLPVKDGIPEVRVSFDDRVGQTIQVKTDDLVPQNTLNLSAPKISRVEVKSIIFEVQQLSTLPSLDTPKAVERVSILVNNWQQLSHEDRVYVWTQSSDQGKQLLWQNLPLNNQVSLWKNSLPADQALIWQQATTEQKQVLWRLASVEQKNDLFDQLPHPELKKLRTQLQLPAHTETQPLTDDNLLVDNDVLPQTSRPYKVDEHKEEDVNLLTKKNDDRNVDATQIVIPNTTTTAPLEAAPWAYVPTSVIDGVTNNGGIQSTAPVKSIEDLQEIVDLINKNIYIIEQSGKTDTVVQYKNTDSIFNNMNIVITSYEHASGQFNLRFENLSQVAQNTLDLAQNKQAIVIALEKLGYGVQMITTTTLNETQAIITDASDEQQSQGRYGRQPGQQGQRDQSQDQEQTQ